MSFTVRGRVVIHVDVPPDIVEPGILKRRGKLVIRELDQTDPGYKVRRQAMRPILDVLHRFGWTDTDKNVSVVVYLNGQPTKLAELGTHGAVFEPLSVIEHIGTLEGA